MALRIRGLPVTHWQDVLPDALHSLRSLLRTATNYTPHERFSGLRDDHPLADLCPLDYLHQTPFSSNAMFVLAKVILWSMRFNSCRPTRSMLTFDTLMDEGLPYQYNI